MDVSVVIATFGEWRWRDLAHERAVPSAMAFGVPVITVHGNTLHEARNTGLASVRTSFVAFLDADDELEPGYLDAMARGTADVRAPSVRYIKPSGIPAKPYVPKVVGHSHTCGAECLRDGNWLVVGSVARTELLREVGGWRDWPVFEDYDIWQRCWLAGASMEAISQAVYRAHVRKDSRNRGPSQELKNATHRAIDEANGVKVAAA